MKTRTKLKIAVIAMIVETVLLAIKQPVFYKLDDIARLDVGLATTIYIYYVYMYKWVRVVCYAFFVYFILVLEKEYHHKVFGHFFIADFVMYVVDAAIVFGLMYAPELATNVRHYTEISIALGTGFTSFMAGTFIYTKIKSPAFKTIKTAYRMFALRCLIYALVLGGELAVHSFGNIGYMALGTYTWWVVLSWLLRMPLLVFSRFWLLWGVLKMKTAKEQHEENKAKGVTHHHHHHHHHSSSKEKKLEAVLEAAD